jgi:selenocysteine lyase/cysteine desulfurase
MVGCRFIEQREVELVAKFLRHFRDQKNLILLGSSTAPRLAIFSFLIYVPAFKKYLHHNFICVLLNDLFGIQVRSGCSCAGPYVIVSQEKFIVMQENFVCYRLGSIGY